MKVGTITTPNQKGQIVIPQQYRVKLGITPQTPLNIMLRGGILYVYPVKEVIGAFDTELSYEQILKRTQGAWGPETKEDKKRAVQKKKIGLSSSQRRKQAW